MSHSKGVNADSDNKKLSLCNLFKNQDKPLNAFVNTPKTPPMIVSHHGDKDSPCCSSSPNSLHNQYLPDQSDGLSVQDNESSKKRTVSLPAIKPTSSNQITQNSYYVLDQWMLNTRRKKKRYIYIYIIIHN